MFAASLANTPERDPAVGVVCNGRCVSVWFNNGGLEFLVMLLVGTIVRQSIFTQTQNIHEDTIHISYILYIYNIIYNMIDFTPDLEDN